MAYLLEQLHHPDGLSSLLESFLSSAPDMMIVTDDGQTVETHKILFTMFSPSIASILSNQPHSGEQCWVILPAGESVARSLVGLLTEGKTFTTKQEDLEEIVSVGKNLGIDFELGWGLKNRGGKVKITKVEEIFEEKMSDDVNVKEETIEEIDSFERNVIKEEEISNNEKERCTECNEEYKYKKALRKHMEQKHSIVISDEKECNDCGKSFPSGEMRKHIKENHFRTKYECSYCGKEFVILSKLNRHQLVHTKETPFECSFERCGKKFSLDFNLKTHMRLHTGERPFICTSQKCERTFTQLVNLKTHMASHSKKNSPC